MPTRVPSRALAIILLTLLLTLAACGTVSTSLCGLSTYASDITVDLEALLALDPEQVAEAGTPDNSAALEALDRLDQTAADGQEALDAASDDEVGAVPRRLFQAALDATGLATDALRSSIESGDPEAVSEAMGQVQVASDAIDAFVAAVDDTRIDCPSASPSASSAPSEPASEPASAEPSVAPTPTAEPTPTGRRRRSDGLPHTEPNADAHGHAQPDADGLAFSDPRGQPDCVAISDCVALAEPNSFPLAVADRLSDTECISQRLGECERVGRTDARAQ